jgi:hypothetical protein
LIPVEKAAEALLLFFQARESRLNELKVVAA